MVIAGTTFISIYGPKFTPIKYDIYIPDLSNLDKSTSDGLYLIIDKWQNSKFEPFFF